MIYLGLFAIYLLPLFYTLPIIHYLYGQKREQKVMWYNLLGAGVNILATLILIPFYGILGALIGTCLAQLVVTFAYVMYIEKQDLSAEDN